MADERNYVHFPGESRDAITGDDTPEEPVIERPKAIELPRWWSIQTSEHSVFAVKAVDLEKAIGVAAEYVGAAELTFVVWSVFPDTVTLESGTQPTFPEHHPEHTILKINPHTLR